MCVFVCVICINYINYIFNIYVYQTLILVCNVGVFQLFCNMHCVARKCFLHFENCAESIIVLLQGSNALLISSAREQCCVGSKPEGVLTQALDDQIV